MPSIPLCLSRLVFVVSDVALFAVGKLLFTRSAELQRGFQESCRHDLWTLFSLKVDPGTWSPKLEGSGSTRLDTQAYEYEQTLFYFMS